VLLALALCGCLQTKDELTLENDGSGKVRIETRLLVSSDALSSMETALRMGGSEPIAFYPPFSEPAARRLFPAKDFKVTVKTETAGNGEQTVIAEASFKDVNALLASPYARAHALSLRLDAGQLGFQAVSGVEAAMRFGDARDESDLLGAQVPGVVELLKQKNELRHEFRVTLPGAIITANGARDGRTAIWVADRAKHTNAAEFAQLAGLVLEASCPANGLKMAPVTPLRLALGTFNDLPAGAVAAQASGPDAGKIQAAAKFVPYALQVTRLLDLSGEGGTHENQAQLFGALVLPRELAPQKWGEPRIDEVVDAKGNSLTPEGGPDVFSRGGFTAQLEAVEEEGGDKSGAPSAEQRKPVTLRFQPPEWKVKEIARIKASMTLQYLGGAQHVIKLTNAVPAKWIRDPKNAVEPDFQDDHIRSLTHPALAELGLTLNFAMGVAQSGFTTLMLQVSGKKGALTDAQVFDATGRPWPTFVQPQTSGQAGACSLSVAGRPSPPLSLALLVTSMGLEVEVPIVLEKVPVGRP